MANDPVKDRIKPKVTPKETKRKRTRAKSDVKVYYAHAMSLYGTKREKEELEQIIQRFPNCALVNPSKLEPPEDDSMEFYKNTVARCDSLVFSRLAGQVTSGVGIEIKHALSLGKPVYELRSAKLFRVKKPVKYLSRDKTRKMFFELLHSNGLRPNDS
jgi:hypothetical protein